MFDSSGKRLDLIGNPTPTGPRTTDMWFNTSAFKPTTGVQGSESRNSLRGPGTNLTDLSVFKTFPVPGRGSIDLRLEVFNVFNRAQYNLPGQVYGNPGFGKITGTQLNTERQVQFGVRYAF